MSYKHTLITTKVKKKYNLQIPLLLWLLYGRTVNIFPQTGAWFSSLKYFWFTVSDLWHIPITALHVGYKCWCHWHTSLPCTQGLICVWLIIVFPGPLDGHLMSPALFRPLVALINPLCDTSVPYKPSNKQAVSLVISKILVVNCWTSNHSNEEEALGSQAYVCGSYDDW